MSDFTSFFNKNVGFSLKKIRTLFVLMLAVVLTVAAEAQNVAKIGSEEYTTLQAAVDAAYATTGDVTIELIANLEEHVLVLQKAGLNLTIDGKDKTLTGQIVVDGVGRSAGTETLLITNINFVRAADQSTGAWKSADAFVAFPSPKTQGTPWYYVTTGTTNHYNYAHNVTIQNCTMDGSDGADNKTMVGVKCPSQAAYNITLDNITIKNAHSLAQFTSTEGITIRDCKATENMYHGLSITGGNHNDIEISGNEIEADDDYGIRIKGTGEKHVTLSENDVEAPNAVVLTDTWSVGSTVDIESGTYIGTESCITDNSGNTELTISGGTYNEEVSGEPLEDGYYSFPNGTEPETYTVAEGYRIVYLANGGVGTNDTVIIKKEVPETEFEVKNCTFEWEDHSFTKWNTQALGGGDDYIPETSRTITENIDLYAQWVECYKIVYHSNSPANTTDEQCKPYGGSITLLGATAFEWDRHVLSGWNTAADGTGTPYTLESEYTTDAVLELYAVWTLKPCPAATDYDGNTYAAVRIGSQFNCWLAENLRSTHYSDSREIKNVQEHPNNSTYGNFYDWYAVMDTVTNTISAIEAAVSANTPLQGICPTGWHVPTEAEYNDLMNTYDATQLMAEGAGWVPDNSTNESGMSLVPSGYYNSDLDRLERMYSNAYFWIATPPTAVYHACQFGAACSSMEMVPGSLKMGYNTRCVANE